MDSRGHGWYRPGPLYHPSGQPPRHRDRHDPYSSPHPGQGHYPPADPREREQEKQWYPPDPRYPQYPITPQPRHPREFVPGNASTPQPSHGYAPNHARPLSRQAYDYPPQTYWDYRDDYGYYDRAYYKGHYGYSDAGGWPVQEGWRSDGHQGRGHEQEWTAATYPDQQGYAPRSYGAQYDGGVSLEERRESMANGNGAVEVCEPGTLASSKASGLSSSSYELSQYMNGAEQPDTAPALRSEPEEPKAVAPLKFCIPHVAVSFGPAGQLVRVSPALPSHGEPAQVELHSMEVVLSDTREQQDMRDFPGPLAREDLHKVDVINFALQMADACLKDKTLADASTAALLWQVLVLLCRQNGRIVGSDIAELLVRGRQSPGACEGDSEQADVGSLIDLSEAPTPEPDSLNTTDLLTGNPLTEEQASEKNLQSYTKLLLAGRKKEALESAMRSGLWGHALFLASKMDSRTYTTVLTRFTGSLASSDPFQTLFHLLSGRIPAAATCYSREKWGDWRPHLAVMLSNETGDSAVHCKSIITMGDTLASRGLLHAAHICYLTAHSPFGWYSNKAQRLVLLGSSHSVSFADFCRNSVIRCTEVFEYSQRLSDSSFTISSFQVYKFLYACRLLDCGLASQAFHYCEVVAKALLTIKEPHVVLMEEVIKLADRLKHSEAQLSETEADLDWLELLRRRQQDMQMGCNTGACPSAAEGNMGAHEESRECVELNPDNQPISEEMIQVNHFGAVEEQFEHSQPAVQPTLSYYASEDQSHAFNALGEQSSSPAAQPIAPEEQLPQTYAPVPFYSMQHSLAASPGQSLGMPGLLSMPADQTPANHADASYHHTTADLIQKSHSNSSLEFSPDTNMDTAEQPPEHLFPPEETKETTSQKPEKESKSGWFSGWFRSKTKETPQDQSTQAHVTETNLEPTPIPTFPPSMPPGPMAAPAMLASHPPAPGINPFSKRAGQNTGVTLGPNFRSMPQAP